MRKELKHIINLYKEDESSLNKIIVSVFVRANELRIENNILIKSLLVPATSPLNMAILGLNLSFTFDDVIEGFELSIPNSEKVINGAVYTPSYIKSFIVDHSIAKLEGPLSETIAADISCGCGAFLFTFAKKMRAETMKPYSLIFRDNIYGLDISHSSIVRAKILLSLLALSVGEDQADFEFNLFNGNALSFDWKKEVKKIYENGGFDLIIGNPPYVRAKNIDDASKVLLSNWKVTKAGNPDLYIPFFEIGLQNINDKGVLGYITVNSFYKSVNARELRRYLQEKKHDCSIIDFGHEKIFTGISAYTCICLILKSKSKSIAFKKESSITLVKNGMESFNRILYKDLSYQRGWLINDKNIVENIKRIESIGTSLGKKYKIRNGIATLSNDTYIFKPVAETENHYILSDKGKQYAIEKSICRNIIKPNILKHEYEIEDIREKLIYPYRAGINVLSLINEQTLKLKFPMAYKYLLDNKERLSKRDKGSGDYNEWYAFGRTQALSDKGFKLMFPYMAKSPHFVFTNDRDMLIYCGYAVFNESEEELKILKRILESKVFEYYMTNTSKPYSAGYLSYAKNYVKNFGICDLDHNERHFLSNGATKDEVDKFLIEKYKILL